ncbi:MAG TPA: hypothetical protein VFF59_01680 [Anaerolineae bacterium]|nr:hypothetical protein [Anaerolineae bacterium]
MKKTSPAKTIKDLRAEYQFDYGQSRPNRFAGKIDQTPLVVTLDPDVAEVFASSEAVNHALRALISAMPPKARRKSSPRQPTA